MKLQLICLIVAQISSGICSDESGAYIEYKNVDTLYTFQFVNGLMPLNVTSNPSVALYTVTNLYRWKQISLRTNREAPPYLQAYWSGYMLVNVTERVSMEKWKTNFEIFDKIKPDLDVLGEEFYHSMRKTVHYVAKNKTQHRHYPIYLRLWFLCGVRDGYKKEFVTSSSQLTKEYLSGVAEKIFQLHQLNHTADFWSSFNGVNNLYKTTYTTAGDTADELTFRNITTGLIIGRAPTKSYNPLPSGIRFLLWWQRVNEMGSEERNQDS